MGNDEVLYTIRIWDPDDEEAPDEAVFEHLTMTDIPEAVEKWQEENGEYFAMEMKVEDEQDQDRV